MLRLVAARRLPGLPASLRILYVAQDSADVISRKGLDVLSAVLASDERREVGQGGVCQCVCGSAVSMLL